MNFTLRRVRFDHLTLVCLAGIAIGLLLLVSPWLTLMVTLGVIICAIALSRPVILCYLIIVAVALTSGMERGKLIPLLIPNEAVLLFSAVITFIVLMVRKSSQKIDTHAMRIAIIVLIIGTMFIPGISYLLRGVNLALKDSLILLGPLQYLLLFWIFANLPKSDLERRNILRLMLLCGAVVAAVGLLQAANFGPVVKLLDQWYSSSHQLHAANYGRITSLMSAWNVLGIFMMANLFMAWAFGAFRAADIGKWLIFITIGLSATCLVVSGSFAGMIGAVLGIFFISILFRGLNRTTIILIIGLLIVFLLTIILFRTQIQIRLENQFRYGGLMPATFIDRFRIWNEIYIPAIKQNLLWGVNLTVPDTYSWQFTESQYINLLFSFGLIGFIAFLIWDGIALSWLIRRFRHSLNNGLTKPILAIAITLLITLSGAGFTNAVFTYSGTVEYLWILLALATYHPEAQS